MPAQSSFDYAIVRVVPRVERGEFINAGVILFCLERDFLAARVELDEPRLRALWPATDVDLVRQHLQAIPRICAGSPDAGPSVSPADLATSTRRAGSVQVTFHGHPLYTFVGDKTAGDTTGQGLSAFGALWYVVGTNGAKITTS